MCICNKFYIVYIYPTYKIIYLWYSDEFNSSASFEETYKEISYKFTLTQ